MSKKTTQLIRELDFDVLVPWAAPAGEPYHDFTDGVDTRRHIDAILRRVRRGGDAWMRSLPSTEDEGGGPMGDSPIGQDTRAREPSGQTHDVRYATCVIVGGGPAGTTLGLLLARRGVDVLVLEKHGDFLRDFRGDTIPLRW